MHFFLWVRDEPWSSWLKMMMIFFRCPAHCTGEREICLSERPLTFNQSRSVRAEFPGILRLNPARQESHLLQFQQQGQIGQDFHKPINGFVYETIGFFSSGLFGK
ncbi:hypothetical protein CEXT_498501 [Caerostris extrusa]|uniref:Uncharacterized protein n=1 Tax=Caerostris extrusa TaxID=172846 RepID=A0AAV4TMK2_CAEEX|nr:hypothetical protein CEXT_498501 [Caerostris extrusa]